MSSTTLFFALLSIVVLGGLALSVYLVGKSVYQDYRYRKFELPIYDEFILDADKQDQEIVNPLEVTKFNISADGENEFIKESRVSAEKMHRSWQAREEEKKRINLKKIKKELSKKKEA